MLTEIEKHKQTRKKFQDKMASLRKRRIEILANISKKFDQQQLESLRKKLKDYD